MGKAVNLLVCGGSGIRTQVFMHARQTNILLLSYTPAPEPALGQDPPSNREAFRITALARQEPSFEIINHITSLAFSNPESVMELQN